MTTAAATADTLGDLFATHDALVQERDGAVLLSRMIRTQSVDDLNAAVTETAAKIAKRIPTLDVTVYTDHMGRWNWCAQHRRFTPRADGTDCGMGPNDADPHPLRCYIGTADATNVEVYATGLPMFDGTWTVAGVLTRDREDVVSAHTVGERDDAAFAIRYAGLMGDCAHCRKLRNRSTTVLLLDTATGEVRPVGKSCLGEYTGSAIRVEALSDLIALRERFASAYGGAMESLADSAPVVDIVALAIRYIALDGFVRSGERGMHGQSPTADSVRSTLGARDGQRPAVSVHQLTDADRAAARADIALMLDESEDSDRDRGSEYLANLRAVLANEWAQWSGRRNKVGLLASLPAAAARKREWAAKMAARDAERAGELNAHIGRLNERRDFTGKIVAHRFIDGDYGMSLMCLIETAEGLVKVFGKCAALGDCDLGDDVTVTGTISEHTSYNGRRQTRITRVKMKA